jgi:hypothetical protein
MLEVIPKVTKAQLEVLMDALEYSSPDCERPSLDQIMLRDRDVVVKAIYRYDHYEVADSVAALKRLVI